MHNKSRHSTTASGFVIFSFVVTVAQGRMLLTYTEFFLSNDGTVTVDVLADQVVEQASALAYE